MPSEHPDPAATPRPSRPPGRSDDERRRQLARMRMLATGLLVLMLAVFVATAGRPGAWTYVHAAAEAGAVGALADWFAVTALFRRPLGLPIPHTALLPRRKAQLARSLEGFLVEHFLTAGVARERVLQARVVERGARWLAQPRHAASAAETACRLGARLFDSAGGDGMRRFLLEDLLPRIVRHPLSPTAGAVLDAVVQTGAHRRLVTLLVGEVRVWLAGNPQHLRAAVDERLPGWAPAWFERLLADRIHAQALDWLQAIQDDPGHRVRVALDDWLATMGQRLMHEPATMAQLEGLKERLLQHDATRALLVDLIDALRASLVDAMAMPDSALRRRVAVEVQGLAERVVADAALRERVERRIADVVAGLVERHADELVRVISLVVERWDAQETSDRIELLLGRDLQFIRINGTLVGALAGLALHALSRAM